MKTIKVNLRERSYPIHIGTEIIEEICSRLRELPIGKKIAIITNPRIKELYGDFVSHAVDTAGFKPELIEVPAGEETKDLDWARKLYDKLISLRMDRRSCLITLGGGVVGDLGGFVASTFMRGIPYIQIPTSLLAQVDSSVGGKTAVNHPQGKNIIGTFYQPLSVFIDISFLKTLPKEEFLNGMAEVVKYGIIADKKLFHYLEENTQKVLSLDHQALEYLASRSCSIKAKIVERDEKETNIRAILNFGHTIGHAIETASGYRYKHGEAVSIGMVYASQISYDKGLCEKKDVQRIEGLLSSLGLPIKDEGLLPEDIVRTLETDKKILDEKIRLILMKEIGKVAIYNDISRNLILRVLRNH
ncbi:MAG TPA: 3-dehydroquinate synthase [Nitrospinota bacterium]|nr:3-dehydroquinate synthase [Nitrospinota bacterium]